jgi:glycosyltransferase involved in cell wall biosynthesis
LEIGLEKGEDLLEEWRDSYRALCAAATGVVVSTPPLAETFRDIATQVRIIPNGIDPEELSHTPHRQVTNTVHVGVSGTKLKFQDDLPWVLPSLLHVGEQSGVRLHFFGGHPEGGARDHWGRGGSSYLVDGVAYQYHPPKSYQEYQRTVGVLDVAALPLRSDLAFNRSRSGQKWMEYALHSTACVLQDLEPHALARHEETCLKATTMEEWEAQLMRLVHDPALRQRIGEAAREDVLANHTMEARRPLWESLVAESRTGA